MALKKTYQAAPEFTEAMLAETQAWFEAHYAGLPPSVATSLRMALALVASLSGSQGQHRALLLQLRRAMGIVASTERKQSGELLTGMPSTPASKLRDKIARLRDELEHSNRLVTWHRAQAKRHKQIGNEKDKRLMKLEDVKLTAEDEAECEAASALFVANRDLGQRCDLACAQATETLMAGGGAQLQEAEIDCHVDRLSLPKSATVTKELFEQRQRLNFSFAVTEVTVNVEKLVTETSQGSEIISASLENIGPPKMRVTWEYLANMAIMVTQYAMPLNRFAGLVSSSAKQFTAGELSRYFNYVATRFVPIYTALGRSLANAEVLYGDDTSSRVLEVRGGLSAREQDSNAVVPWASFATAEQARTTLESTSSASMAVHLASTFGFEFSRKDGQGNKRGFNTTVLSGRTEQHDPKSTVVFYRSHLGGLGDLLDMILSYRKKELKDLVVQCDLSSVNLVSEPAHQVLFNIVIAGCASHARRPFALFEKDDPQTCAAILHGFKGVFMHERFIDLAGRNTENTLAIRSVDAKECWEASENTARTYKKYGLPKHRLALERAMSCGTMTSLRTISTTSELCLRIISASACFDSRSLSKITRYFAKPSTVDARSM
jgi:hypothetical protein